MKYLFLTSIFCFCVSAPAIFAQRVGFQEGKRSDKNVSVHEFSQLKKSVVHQEKLLQEILMGEIFLSSIADSKWLTVKNFSPAGWAASFTFLYALYRILDDCNPKCILEMGIGQTTKMTTQYVATNKAAKLLVVDHNQQWIDLFKPQITQSENVQILRLNLEKASFEGKATAVYQDLAKSVGETKFDLIIVDGGDRGYRTSVFDLIPNNLEKSFVIILDDYHFQDKNQTGKALLAKLKTEKIAHGHAVFSGLKKQLVIFSPNFKFLKSI
ncbi:MAG: hypothetical protein WCW33_00135 [Candidatus Babeliales bacterium]|jgi:hypothetical protein